MPLKKIVDKRLVQEFENEVVVYDQDNHSVYHLNEAAAAAWELCENCNSIFELTQQLAKKTGLPADDQVTRLALSELRDAKLIEGSLDDRVEHVISRRQLTQSLGRAAIALPAIAAMVAPTAAMAQSAPQTTGTGTPPPPPPPTTSGPSPTTTSPP